MDLTLFKYARQFLSGTLISRSSGFFRDISMAYAFGDIPEVASLILAYRLCMLLRRVLGEGSMQSAFVPGYQTLKSKNPQLASDFFKNVFTTWMLLITLICLFLGIIFTPFKVFFSPSWAPVIDLSIRLLPCLVFVVGYTILQSLLQCHGRYFISSIAPVFSNVLWGVGCLVSKQMPIELAMKNVAFFICIGLFLQWVCLVPEAMKFIPKPFFKMNRKSSENRESKSGFIKAVALAAIGVSATQINSALDGIFAKVADPSGPMHLWFSIRIQQLPLALLSIGLISAAAPKLCELVATGEPKKAQELIFSVKSKLHLLMTFLTGGVLCFGDQIIGLLFEHGMFNHHASFETTLCLMCYIFGLVPTSLATVYASFFYALKEYKKPSTVSVICLGVNLVLNYLAIFTFGLSSWSVALSTSLCSFLNSYLLKKALEKKGLIEKERFFENGKSYLVTLASLLCVMALKPLFSNLPSLLALPISVTLYIASYISFCRLIRFDDPKVLFQSIVPLRIKR
jgi:putative peptidoglycan lipid II flippase